MNDTARPRSDAQERLPVAFLCVLSVVMALTFRLPNLEGWDDRFYVAQLSSMLGDQDLMLHDDLLAFENVTEAARLRTIADINPARAGALANNFGIGPAVIHSFYLWPELVGARGLPSRLRVDSGLGCLVLLALTILAMRTLLIELGFDSRIAGGCALLAAYAGPLAVYGTRLQMNSHLPSAMCGILVLLFAWRWTREGGRTLAALLGLCCGLAAIVRWQDTLLGLAIPPFLLTRLVRNPGRRLSAIKELSVAAGLAMALLMVQVLAFARHNGQVEGVPQGSAYMNWLNPQIGHFLLSPLHGLIPWTPLFALGLLALPFAATRAPASEMRWFLGSLSILAVLQGYVSAAPLDWWGGSAFGARRLSTLTGAAAIGLASIATASPRPLVLAGAVAASCWSAWVTFLFSLHFDDLRLVMTGRTSPGSPFSFDGYPPVASLTWDAFRRFLTETFSLVDPTPPSALERLWGATACLLACLGTSLLWRWFCASSRFRAAVAATAAAWALVWLAALWQAPGNEAVNRAWLAVEEGTATERDLEVLPPEVVASGQVLRAWRAVRAGRIEEARRLLARSRSPQFPPIGLAELSLLDETVVRRGER